MKAIMYGIGTVALAFDYNSTANYDFDWNNPATDDIEE